MSKPPDSCTKLSETLSLCEYKTGGSLGFWLYDKTRGMNLSMRAKTETAAFIGALEYYQRRLFTAESELKSINEKVDIFVTQVRPENNY